MKEHKKTIDLEDFLKNLLGQLDQHLGKLGYCFELDTTEDYLVISVSGQNEPFQVFIEPRDDQRKYFRQTRLFNLFFQIGDATCLEEEQERVFESVLQIISRAEEDLTSESVRQFFKQQEEPQKELQPEILEPVEKRKRATVKLASKCNTNCFFCNTEGILTSKFQFFDDLEQITQLLERSFDNGCNVVSFDGGEPTMSPILKDLVQCARNLGFTDIGMVTNGIRLADEQYLKDLHQAGLNVVSFSMHAPDSDISHQIYGRDQTDAQLKALGNIKKLGQGLALTLQVVLVAQNIGTLKQLLDLFVTHNPGEVILIYCIPPDNWRRRIKEAFLPDLDDSSIMNVIKQFRQKHPKISLSLRNFPFCKVPVELWENIQGHQGHPQNLRRKLNIFTRDLPNHYFCMTCENRNRCSFPIRQYFEQKSGKRMLLLDNLLRCFRYDYLSQKFRKGS
ncbi:MAG: radical SAM protein [Deltaproteobacteria bacterium]|nr:radical SAM protein [Deltaproteobacteria bacterium]